MTKPGNVQRCVDRLLLVLVLAVFVVAPGLHTEGKAQSDKERLGDVLLKLRKLYLDTQSDVNRLQILRQSGKKGKAEKQREELKKKFESGMKPIEDLFESTSSGRTNYQKQRATIKNILSYYREYQRKILSNWKPKNPEIYKALNDRRLIEKGYAKPEMLKDRFLMELTGMLYSGTLVEQNPMREKLDQYENEIRNMHEKVQQRFLKLLKQVKQAKEKDEKEKEKILQNVRSSWNKLWDQFNNTQKRLRNGINRQLRIFRNRERLTKSQKEDLRQGRRLKRRFLNIMEFREREDLFSNPENSWDFLVFLARKNLQRYTSLLDQNIKPILGFFSQFSSIGKQVKLIESKKAYKNRSKVLSQTIDMMYKKNLGYVTSSLSNIQEISVDDLTALSEQLLDHHRTKEERQLGKMCKKLKPIVLDLKTFAEKAKEYPRKFQKAFEDTEFKSVKQFRKKLKEVGGENLEDLSKKNQQLADRFAKFKQQTEKVLQSLKKQDQKEQGEKEDE